MVVHVLLKIEIGMAIGMTLYDLDLAVNGLN